MSEQVDASGPMYRASREADQSIDPGTRRLLYLLGGAGVVMLGGILAYSLIGHSGGEVPVIQADNRPIRVRPDNPGGMAVSRELQQADPNKSQLASEPEEPNPRGLYGTAEAGRPAVSNMAGRANGKLIAVQLTTAKSEAAAQNAWDKLAKRLPSVFAGHRPLFQKTEEPGPAPWRLRTGGFTDPAQAKAFCDQVKAKGGKCAVVDI